MSALNRYSVLLCPSLTEADGPSPTPVFPPTIFPSSETLPEGSLPSLSAEQMNQEERIANSALVGLALLLSRCLLEKQPEANTGLVWKMKN